MQSLFHLAYHVTDLDAARTFYRDRLGLPLRVSIAGGGATTIAPISPALARRFVVRRTDTDDHQIVDHQRRTALTPGDHVRAGQLFDFLRSIRQ